jgi:hypothetical protein
MVHIYYAAGPGCIGPLLHPHSLIRCKCRCDPSQEYQDISHIFIMALAIPDGGNSGRKNPYSHRRNYPIKGILFDT